MGESLDRLASQRKQTKVMRKIHLVHFMCTLLKLSVVNETKISRLFKSESIPRIARARNLCEPFLKERRCELF